MKTRSKKKLLLPVPWSENAGSGEQRAGRALLRAASQFSFFKEYPLIMKSHPEEGKVSPWFLGPPHVTPILQRGQRDEWSGTFKSPADISHPQSNSSHIQAPWLQHLTINTHQYYPILQMPKQRFQQAKLFAQGHCTSAWGLRNNVEEKGAGENLS